MALQPLQPLHDVHRRRFGRNVGVGLLLGAFVVLVFALTLVKLTRGDSMEGYDHVVQPGLVPQDAPAEGQQ